MGLSAANVNIRGGLRGRFPLTGDGLGDTLGCKGSKVPGKDTEGGKVKVRKGDMLGAAGNATEGGATEGPVMARAGMDKSSKACSSSWETALVSTPILVSCETMGCKREEELANDKWSHVSQLCSGT